jgi:hypothetical protein
MEDVGDGAFLNDGRLLLEIKRPGLRGRCS